MSAMLEAALEYRSLGFAVLPLAGKAPDVGLLRRTHGTRSTNRLVELGANEEQVRAWFSEPGVNVGVFCGTASRGLVVVDLDDCEFPPPGSTLPLTPLVKTGRGQHRGYHLYYRSNEDIATKRFAWGEIRGGSPSYVVAPPSVHPDTSRRYAWQLPLQNAPLADFSSLTLPPERPASANGSTKNQIRPTEDVLLGTPRPTADRGGWLRSFDTNPGAVIAMARELGITAPLATPFPCVLHPDGNPSAALHPTADTGEWLYHDFHAARHNAKEWLSLAQVRAALAGRVGKLSPSEHATWKLILLVEAGLLPLAPVPAIPLPWQCGRRASARIRAVPLPARLSLELRLWRTGPVNTRIRCRTVPDHRPRRPRRDRLSRKRRRHLRRGDTASRRKKLRLWLPREVEHGPSRINLEQEPT